MTSPSKLTYARERRAKLRAAGLCINSPSHPRPVNGVRCWLCVETHRGNRKPRADRTAAPSAFQVLDNLVAMFADARRKSRRAA